MLLMPFAGMPINTLHSFVLICTSYFQLMAFHMYSRACVNVNYILMCIHHHSSVLFLAIYLFEFNLLSLPFFRMATKEGKEKATPKPPARKGTKKSPAEKPQPPSTCTSQHAPRTVQSLSVGRSIPISMGQLLFYLNTNGLFSLLVVAFACLIA